MKRSRLFEFYALTYPKHKSPGYMRGELLRFRAHTEFEARGKAMRSCHKRGYFVWTIESHRGEASDLA